MLLLGWDKDKWAAVLARTEIRPETLKEAISMQKECMSNRHTYAEHVGNIVTTQGKLYEMPRDYESAKHLFGLVH